MSTGSRRFHPLALRVDRRISRPRLNRLLAQRFETRLTIVTAAAGHGKSTALAEAVANNILNPAGQDIWLAAAPADADPAHFFAGLAQDLDIEPTADLGDAIDAVANRIWAMAPTEVALIVDDAHYLASEASVEAVQALIEALPANGHLLLAGRADLPLRMVRLQALDLVTSVTQDQLLFDGDELAELIASRGNENGLADAGELPRLPAMADLQLRVGTAAGIEYLWQEILGRLDTERLHYLARSAVLEDLDDEMVMELSGGRINAGDLTSDLPMVELGEHRRYRLHSLLRQALLDRLTDDDRRDASITAANFELKRGRLVPATALLTVAGQEQEALDIIRRFATLPLLQMSLDETRAIIALARTLAPGSLLLQILEAQNDYGSYDNDRIQRFVGLARRGAEEGDDQMEALAIHRAVQGLEQGDDPLPQDLVQRIGILATETDFARAIDAHIGIAGALQQGDSDAARFLLRHYEGFGEHGRDVMRAERLCQLGLMEEVATNETADDIDGPPSGSDTFIAFAMWLRGEADPDLALAVVREMIPLTMSRSWRYNKIAVLGVATHIAIAAGHRELAGRWAAMATEISSTVVAPGIQTYALLANASVAWANEAHAGDERSILAEDEAGDRRAATGGHRAHESSETLLQRALETAPIGQWPGMAYLLAVPMVYSARPETREVFDRCDFGHSLRTAVAAGQALGKLREAGSAIEAAALPWDKVDLLRAHVQPRDLIELAMAAAEQGATDALAVADLVPEVRPLVEWVVSLTPQPGSESARRHLESLPLPPPPRLHIRTLGDLEPNRGPASVDENTWRRARVRELLGFLVEHRTTSRRDAAAALWPELDEAKAAANLRVNLSHLLNAIEPDRASGAASSYVQVDGERLALTSNIDIDVDELDRKMNEARRLDRDGAPADALVQYRQAAELAHGPYLEGIEADWAFGTRVRVRSAVVDAWSRIGELTLAQGEPEAASEWATKAYRLSVVDERAARLLMSCLTAVGDRAAALTTADKLRADLGEAGLEPEPLTLQLIERIRRRG